jgi:hypothetical protein
MTPSGAQIGEKIRRIVAPEPVPVKEPAPEPVKAPEKEPVKV